MIEEVAFEGAEAWVAAGDTGFPETPVRGVRLLPYFNACVIAAQPHELLVDGTVAGVWHQRRQGRRTTVTVEPLGRLTAARERELGERVERVGEVLEARAELVFGEVTVGPHA